MICPYCHHTEDKVVDSRSSGLSIRRRRECLACGRRFTTYEYVEVVPLTVTKRDGRHEPFKREKLLAGIDAACKKRPVSRQAIEEIWSWKSFAKSMRLPMFDLLLYTANLRKLTNS